MTQSLCKLYEGKAKVVFRLPDPELVLMQFKDDATAFDGKKKGTIAGKGRVNNLMSAELFRLLEANGVRTHFVRLEGETGMVVRSLDMVKLEVVVRNIAAGSLSRRLGIPEGTELPRAVVEFYYKDDSLGDPLVTESHIEALDLAPADVVAEMRDTALRVNEVLKAFLRDRGLILVDFKLEFGTAGGQLVLGDEISPDTCRLWDVETRDKLDKDRFRRDMGGVDEAYSEVLARITGGGRR
ncbi:MAG: phosphoribosylaminoimidazolesuccinocarboxamide synthase [Firmicutes bacterium]|nr:phosphoribosylaminoimidazolesuccinocarboxamide synthase [Bacillota bacterium]